MKNMRSNGTEIHLNFSLFLHFFFAFQVSLIHISLVNSANIKQIIIFVFFSVFYLGLADGLPYLAIFIFVYRMHSQFNRVQRKDSIKKWKTIEMQSLFLLRWPLSAFYTRIHRTKFRVNLNWRSVKNEHTWFAHDRTKDATWIVRNDGWLVTRMRKDIRISESAFHRSNRWAKSANIWYFLFTMKPNYMYVPCTYIFFKFSKQFTIDWAAAAASRLSRLLLFIFSFFNFNGNILLVKLGRL